jgi:RNA polymerase sigma factor, sigma-70 family
MNNSQIISQYAKKIYGFAYGKTGNIHDAEDLSQDILTALHTSIPKYGKIDNPDGFVYTVCSHCWSNFYRANKKHWSHADIDDMDIADTSDVESEVETRILIEKMRKEIAYLSRLHRDIIVKTYYDGKTSTEISRELNIPNSTVRYHLVEIRKKLKERIEMNTEKLSYTPVVLSASAMGRTGMYTAGIGNYRLVDSIVCACYGKPLTIEGISQKLSVAAVFIENHLHELVYMDFVKVVDGTKYQTNFFIRDEAFSEISLQYISDNVAPYAERIYEALDKRYGDIAAINFAGSDTGKNYLMWILTAFLTMRLEGKSGAIISQREDCSAIMPKRQNGSEAWLHAYLRDDNFVSTLTEKAAQFAPKARFNFCDPCIWEQVWSLQVYFAATIEAGGRPALREREFEELSRIMEIINRGAEPEDYGKTLIARYAEQGYVKVEDGKVKMLIPYLQKAEYDRLNAILSDIECELGDDFFVPFIEGYVKIAKTKIPSFISDNERNHAATSISCVNAVPSCLEEMGKLTPPTEEEARRLGIIIYKIGERRDARGGQCPFLKKRGKKLHKWIIYTIVLKTHANWMCPKLPSLYRRSRKSSAPLTTQTAATSSGFCPGLTICPGRKRCSATRTA